MSVVAAGVAESGEDVPGGGDDQQKQQSGEGSQQPPAFHLTGKQQVDEGRAEEEDQGDEPLGQDGERKAGPHDVGIEEGAGVPDLGGPFALLPEE